MSVKEQKDFDVSAASLKEIRAFAREVLSKVPELESTTDDVVLALAEAAQNVVKHAYNGHPTTDQLRVEICYENKVLTLELLDKGQPAVPQNIKPRKLDEIRPGGLGTFFIGQIMDEIVFKTSRKDWINHLVLTKRY